MHQFCNLLPQAFFLYNSKLRYGLAPGGASVLWQVNYRDKKSISIFNFDTSHFAPSKFATNLISASLYKLYGAEE